MARRILSCFVIVFLGACSETTERAPLPDYFPLEDGLFWEYEVTDITYSLTEAPKVDHFFQKERLSRISDKTYKVELFTKKEPQEGWLFDAVGSISVNENRLLRNEAGISKVIQFVPMSDGLIWNQNAFNTSSESTVSTSRKGEPFSRFQNTIWVIEKQDSSLISKDCIYAVYGEGLGLVYQEITDIEYCQTSADCIGSGEIDSGKRYTKTLISSGKE